MVNHSVANQDRQTMPRVNRVLETALYFDDRDRAVRFYTEVMGLSEVSRGDRPQLIVVTNWFKELMEGMGG